MFPLKYIMYVSCTPSSVYAFVLHHIPCLVQAAKLEAAKKAEEERKTAQEAEKLAKEAADKLDKEKAPSTTSAPNVRLEVKSAGMNCTPFHSLVCLLFYLKLLL